MLPIEFEAPRETYNPNRPPMARIIDRLPGDATAVAVSARESANDGVEDPLQLWLPLDAACGESR